MVKSLSLGSGGLLGQVLGRGVQTSDDQSASQELALFTHTHAASEVIEADARTLEEVIIDDVKSYFAALGSAASFDSVPDETFLENQFFDFSFLEGYETVEHYWVNRPYAFVSVLFDPGTDEYSYHVCEPALDSFEQYVRQDLTKALRNRLLYSQPNEADRISAFHAEARDVIREQAATIGVNSLYKLLYYLLREFVNFGRVDAIMRDRNIEDVSCDGSGIPVFVYHAEYRDLPTNVVFDAGELNSFVVRLAQRSGKGISVSEPLVDASLPDGSRVQLTLGTDITTRGSNFTIRKFSDVPLTPVDLIQGNTFSIDQMAYFWLCIEHNRSLVFAGGTGSGKTTSMNAISFFIPPNAKVVSIEDTREITLPHDNWIQALTRESFTRDRRGEVTTYELLQAALRQRPEYLLIGEMRTEPRVALTFFHAISTGHCAYSTMHADSVAGVVNRLQNPPLSVPAQMVEQLDVVSIQRQVRMGEDRVRRNHEIAELMQNEDGRVGARIVFTRDPNSDEHRRLGDSLVLAAIAEERGWTEAQLADHLDQRARVLQYLLDIDPATPEEVAAVIHAFYRNPGAVLAAIEDEAPDISHVTDVGAAVVTDDDAHVGMPDGELPLDLVLADSLATGVDDPDSVTALYEEAMHAAATAEAAADPDAEGALTEAERDAAELTAELDPDADDADQPEVRFDEEFADEESGDDDEIRFDDDELDADDEEWDDEEFDADEDTEDSFEADDTTDDEADDDVAGVVDDDAPAFATDDGEDGLAGAQA